MKWDTCDPSEQYLLHLGDDALVLGHRLSEWCGHGPILEEDIALSNLALDLVGLARQYYQLAAKRIGAGTTEDQLAYWRGERDFKNHVLVEQPNGDFADTMARQFLFDAFHLLQLEAIEQSNDAELAAIARKALKETTYHAQHSAEWIVRMGDGTDESHRRISSALLRIWPFTGEFFLPAEVDRLAAARGLGPDVQSLREPWLELVREVIAKAQLSLPVMPQKLLRGKSGIHSESLGFLLAEMQSLPRAYPDAQW
ncbi:MAG: phenylacetate-CoA oxygenase subunit PaaI [Flavobacteriaceae bacterium]|nr:phenylacetate-CoA oxygenase subunit PaaI [Flavobacteriaceae bacterium]PHX83736.1 MAG: phenylacetate-CoA oxygenase subunit PaaI [Flavobacteriales bacterium]